jgi:hypothetical protein
MTRTCGSCLLWDEDTAPSWEERPDRPAVRLGQCNHPRVNAPALDEHDESGGSYYVLTTEDAACAHWQARPVQMPHIELGGTR